MIVALAALEGCGGSLAQPFDQMQKSQMTVYVLQNYTPPPQQTAATPAPAAAGPAGGLQQMIQQGIALAQQWVPGLQIPGLTPGAAATPTAQPTPQQDPSKYFHEYYILSWKAVSDDGTKSDIASLFGKEKDFNAAPGACFYPNLGIAIAQPNGAPPADILISLSPCSQVRAFNITWPYPSKLGIESDTEKSIDAIVRKVFQG